MVENFYSQMRSRNDMPTVLEFAYFFVPTICESLKQLTDTGFVYYTSPHSYYEAPESTKIPFRDLPSIPYPASVEMSKEDQMMMGDWRDNFGKPVRHTRHWILFQGLRIFLPQMKSQLHIQRSQRCNKLAEGHVFLKLIV